MSLKKYIPHLHALLDDAPVSLLGAVAEQLHDEANISREIVWKNYRSLARQVKSRRESGDEQAQSETAGRVDLAVSPRTETHVAPGTAIPGAHWTFGGGTVLMLRIAHRQSKDIDLFVPDPQYLGYINPRLSDVAESISTDYEEAAECIKLFLPDGEIDVVVGSSLESGDLTGGPHHL